MSMPARTAASLVVLVTSLAACSPTAQAEPNGPKDVKLKSPHDGDVFFVGDEIVVSGKCRENPSPAAQVFCYMMFNEGSMSGWTNPTDNKWSIGFVPPIPSDPVIVLVFYADYEKGIYNTFTRTISVLPYRSSSALSAPPRELLQCRVPCDFPQIRQNRRNSGPVFGLICNGY